ncbi:MAG: dehydrogenase [Thermoleophilia bacterium]|nr:dehydrogenase [Thermoleophilia bacterium]
MRALILHGPGDVRLEDVPVPSPTPGEVVLEVTCALTCATDAKILRQGGHPSIPPAPAPFGHEAAGVVRVLGEGVTDFADGDVVVVANSAPCDECLPCRRGRPSLCESIVYLSGAYAEYLRVPARIVARNMLRVPSGLALEHAAMVEPLACAVRGVERVAALAGDEVVVLGGGVQGTLIAALLAGRGCIVTLCDPHQANRDRALHFGAARTMEAPRDSTAIDTVRRAHGGGRGPDAVVEAVGRPEVWEVAVALARPGGEVLLYGGCAPGTTVTLPTAPLHYGELSIRGTYHHTPECVRQALAHLAAGDAPYGLLLGDEIDLAEVPTVLTAPSGPKHPVRMTERPRVPPVSGT